MGHYTMGNKPFRMGVVYADGQAFSPPDFSDESDDEYIDDIRSICVQNNNNDSKILEVLGINQHEKHSIDNELDKKFYKGAKKAEKRDDLEQAKILYKKAYQVSENKKHHKKYKKKYKEIKKLIKREKEADVLYQKGKNAEEMDNLYQAKLFYENAYLKSKGTKHYKKYKEKIKNTEKRISLRHREETLLNASKNHLISAQEKQDAGFELQDILSDYKQAYQITQKLIDSSIIENKQALLIKKIASCGIQVYSHYLELTEDSNNIALIYQIIQDIQTLKNLLQESPCLAIPIFLQEMDRVIDELNQDISILQTEITVKSHHNVIKTQSLDISHSLFYREDSFLDEEILQQREIGRI